MIEMMQNAGFSVDINRFLPTSAPNSAFYSKTIGKSANSYESVLRNYKLLYEFPRKIIKNS